MAPRKKNQTTEEQENQDQEQTTQEQTTQEQTTQEQTGGQEEQTTQEQTGGQEEQTTQEDKHGQETERDEFADIPNPCVYCGPSVRGVARQYTTYQGGIPKELKAFVKEHPAAWGLIVSTARFADVRKRLETPGTAEAIIYRKVKDEL